MSEVTKEQRDTFYSLVKKVFQNLLPQIQKHIDEGKTILTYSDYPVHVSHSEGKWPSTSTTESLRYFLTNKGVYNYSTILSVNNTNDRVLLNDIDGFSELINYISSNKEIMLKIWYPEDYDYTYLSVLLIIGALTDRYIAKNSNTIFVEDFFKEIYKELINSYFEEKLCLDICIPILMLEFEEDYIEISDSYYIEKMSDEFIRSKYNIGNYVLLPEKLVLDCATHMLIIKGYSLDNDEYRKYTILNEAEAYPIEIINFFFGVLRACTKSPTGYAQLVGRPTNNWISRDIKGELMGLVGTRARKYPEYFLEHYWFKPHSILSSSIIEEVRELFLQVLKLKNTALILAIDRLNRSVLRNNKEDTILDAVIGIELLLTDNDKGELTYKISTRMAALSTLDDSIPYSPVEIKKSLGKIYRYRSDIVHSRKPRQETKSIKVNEKVEIEPIELAIDYLKYAIRILAKYPQYMDVKKIDELIMKKLEGQNLTKRA